MTKVDYKIWIISQILILMKMQIVDSAKQPIALNLGICDYKLWIFSRQDRI